MLKKLWLKKPKHWQKENIDSAVILTNSFVLKFWITVYHKFSHSQSSFYFEKPSPEVQLVTRAALTRVPVRVRADAKKKKIFHSWVPAC